MKFLAFSHQVAHGWRGLCAVGMLALVAALPTSQAQAQGSNCDRLPTAAEREICTNRRLTRLDDTLNAIYGELRDALSRAEFQELRDAQRDWLRARNRCGTSKPCLARRYVSRIGELKERIDDMGPLDDAQAADIAADEPAYDPNEGLVWSTRSFNDASNNGRFTAVLSYGIPETDAVAFEAACAAGTSARIATAILGYPVDGMENGSAADVELSAGSYRGTLRGEVYGARLDEGVSGLILRIDLDDPVWEALARFRTLEYSVEGRRGRSLSLSGSKSPVDQFIDACRSMSFAERRFTRADERTVPNARIADRRFDEDSADFDDETRNDRAFDDSADFDDPTAFDDTPTRRTTRTAEIDRRRPRPLDAPSVPGQLSCAELGEVRSRASEEEVEITFVNRANARRSVVWIDFDGQPVNYADLDPGESYAVKTYRTHPWMFTDAPGNCLEMLLIDGRLSRFEITRPNQDFGPE